MASQLASPLQVSRSSSSSSLSSRRAAKLTLDLSDLPQLSEPTPPSNTLIITVSDFPPPPPPLFPQPT